MAWSTNKHFEIGDTEKKVKVYNHYSAFGILNL